MYQQIPGGTTQRIEFGDEFIEVHLPPVGYVIDKMPDPKTGKPSEKLIKSEILFDDLPLIEKKWKKTELPKNWDKWIDEENTNKQINPEYRHPDAEYFRAQEWRRRINGVWIAIGNRNKKPVEYVYLTGFAYFYLTWWFNGYNTKFRFVLLRIFYALAWAEENPVSYGLIFSTLRRLGKTAIAYCYLFELPSRKRYCYGGSQAQKEETASEFFSKFLIDPFLKLPEFFVPKFNDGGQFKTGLYFKEKILKGKNSGSNFEKKDFLYGDITFRETKSNAYDKSKLHRYIVEEPGKWDNANIYDTYNKVKPALKDGPRIIGKAFLPTTIEELQSGGDAFIKLFEDSLPSLMKKNDGYTTSGLISLFIPAYDGFIFDEYGRSVVDDPAPNEEVYDDISGERILKGAKSQLLHQRKILSHDLAKLSIEMRQYPWSWEEAKSMSNQFCHFNHMLLQKRLQDLMSAKPKYITGNFDWTKGVDSDVEFFRDDHKGRWRVSWLPDQEGNGGDVINKRITNNVSEEWDSENGKKVYGPKNNHLFAMGCDPIRNIQTDDPTASKAAMYVFMKYNPHWDTGIPREKWRSYRFIVEYINRPDDPIVFHEDMIKTCRYFSVSMFEEGNIETLRMHFILRGYAPFLLNRGHFSDKDLPGVKKEGNYADKAVRTDEVVTHNLIQTLQIYYNKDIDKVDFPQLLEDSLAFRIKKHHKKDAVFGAGYTLISAGREVEPPDPTDNSTPIELELFQMFDQSGDRSREIDIGEIMTSF